MPTPSFLRSHQINQPHTTQYYTRQTPPKVHRQSRFFAHAHRQPRFFALAGEWGAASDLSAVPPVLASRRSHRRHRSQSVRGIDSPPRASDADSWLHPPTVTPSVEPQSSHAPSYPNQDPAQARARQPRCRRRGALGCAGGRRSGRSRLRSR